MRYLKINILFLFVFSMLIIQSCSEEADLISVEEARRNNRGPGGNNGGGNNGGGNNDQGADIEDINSEVVEEWTALFLEIDRYAAGMRPNSTARSLAYINLAGFEAVAPAMTELRSNESFLRGFDIDLNRKADNIDYQIALNKTYSIVMDHFILNLPSDQRDKIEQLEIRIEDVLGQNISSRVVTDSKSWGTHVAERVIEYAQSDEQGEEQILSPQPLSYEPPTGDGYWTYSAEEERALFPYWESVRTFIVSADETTTIAPISYSEDPSSPYYQQMVEVYEANNTAKEEDNEQLWIAEFWSDDVETLMFSPPARQFSIANQLLDQFNLNLEESLYLLLKLGFSMNDAAVSTWKYKYEHMVMRPNVFIHEFIDPSYQTNLYRLVPWPNPTFPGYPSGHSCFASAAGGVFIDFFGDDLSFTDRSHEGRTEFRGTPRRFTSFSDMAAENAYSRIPLGVHIEMDCTEGLRLGYEIADGINEYDLRR